MRSGRDPARPRPSSRSRRGRASICLSVGWSSGAHAITPDVYLCSNSSESATAATISGLPSQHLDALARLPGRVLLPEEVFGRSPRRPGPVREKLNVHRCPSGLSKRASAVSARSMETRRARTSTASAAPLWRIGPPRDLVQVVPDPRDLPGALALDLGRAGGPRPRAGHRPPDQRRQGHAGGLRLGPPVGGLGRADTRAVTTAVRRSGITPHRHGGRGAEPPSATSTGARRAGGSKGGRRPPLASPIV